MSFIHTYTLTYSADGSTPFIAAVSNTSGAENNISETVAGATTDGLVAYAADLSQMKSCVICCKTRDMTVKTNSSGAPDKTISLKAGVPVVWDSNNGQANPFGTVDVTALYVTLAAGDDAVLDIRNLIDPTV